jgi:hypothetical protein
MARIPALLLVLAGCGAGAPPPATPGTPTTPGAPHAFTGPTLPEPLLAALAGKTLYIEDFTSLMLFADERLAAQQIIADWATANHLSVLPPATTEAAIAKAARGINPVADVTCGPVLPRDLAIERYVTADGHIKASVYCAATCTLQVEFVLDGMGTEFYASGFDTTTPWRDELATRLPTVVDNGGHDQYGHLNNPVEVTGVARGAADLVPDRNADRELGADGATIARSCGATGLDLTLLVDRGRCERLADSTYITEPDPTIAACACDRVLPELKPTARTIVHLPAPAETPEKVQARNNLWAKGELIGGDEYRTFGVAWFVPGQLDARVSQCFADRATAEDGHEVKATILFDQDGAATAVTIADLDGLLLPGESACLESAIKVVRTPCPSEQHPVGTARVYWRVAAD